MLYYPYLRFSVKKDIGKRYAVSTRKENSENHRDKLMLKDVSC